MPISYTLDEFTAVHNFMDLSFSPDGKWAAYCNNASGQFNLWRQRIDINLEDPFKPIQLTHLADTALLRASWSPDGKRLVTMADDSGYGLHQLYEMSPSNGELVALTNAPEARHELARFPFSPDGRSVVYAANARDPMEFDVMVRDLETGDKKILLSGGANYFPDSWSSDGRYILAFTMGEAANNNLFLYDLHTGKSQCVTGHEGEALFWPGAWHPAGTGFYYLSNEAREFTGLAWYDLGTGKSHWVETPDWDVQAIAVSCEGRFLAWVVNEDGYSRLYVKDGQTNYIKQYPDLPRGVITRILFSPTTSLLGIYLSRAVHPTNLYLLEVESGTWRCVTHSFVGGIPEEEMVEPVLIRYPSHDGLQIPAFLYQPRLPKKTPVPVVIFVHGGPEEQELPTYTGSNGLYQYLIHSGIGVFAPNIRGSTGYGKRYQQHIHRDWGGGELRDLEFAYQYLQSLGWVDPTRIGLFGASFGGFVVLSGLSRLPECHWAAAVDISGPSNLITYTQTVPAFARAYMKATVGDPVDDADFLRDRSPLTHVENIRAPLLVIQGAHDPIVPRAESEQIVASLRAMRREVAYKVFEDEGHLFAKTESLMQILRDSAAWFERHLLT